MLENNNLKKQVFFRKALKSRKTS